MKSKKIVYGIEMDVSNKIEPRDYFSLFIIIQYSFHTIESVGFCMTTLTLARVCVCLFNLKTCARCGVYIKSLVECFAR